MFNESWFSFSFSLFFFFFGQIIVRLFLEVRQVLQAELGVSPITSDDGRETVYPVTAPVLDPGLSHSFVVISRLGTATKQMPCFT